MAVLLTRPMGESISRIVPRESGEDFGGTILDEEFLKDGIGVIELPIKVLTLKGRVDLHGRNEPRIPQIPQELDLEDPQAATWITTEIKVPYLPNFELATGVETVDSLRWHANQILMACKDLEDGTKTEDNLRSWVRRYQDKLVSHIIGHKGLLTSDILSIRCCNSMRGVAVPDTCLHHFQVRLPRQAAQVAGIRERDWVLLVRQPVLHEGGMILQEAWFWDDPAIGCNPSVLKPLGLDFDGDTVAIFRVPTEERPVFDEVLSKPLEELKEYGAWSDELLLYNDVQDIDWDNFMRDLEFRTQIDGLTFGPIDAMNPRESRFVRLAHETGCKSYQEDVTQWANGVDVSTFVRESYIALEDVVRMKVQIGPIGAITDKINQLMLRGGGTAALATGLKFKELLTQALMDAKHGTDHFRIEPIVDIFERRGRWKTATEGKAVKRLVEMGLPQEMVTEVISHMWEYYVEVEDKESGEVKRLGIGATQAIRDNLPLFNTTRYRPGPADLVGCLTHREQSGAAALALQIAGVSRLGE